MTKPFLLYGWQLSYFSGKARAYLRYKQIPFREREVDGYTLMRRIPRKTGSSPVMPVVVTPEGEWLQDTTHIIETLEQRFLTPSVYPESAALRVLAQLLEAWADEWWIPIAMHYRWSYPENEALFLKEAGRALVPFAPAFLQRRLARRPATLLKSYLPGVGVVPEQFDLMERWTEAMLDALDQHFAHHDFLLGGRPCVADFALIGPLYAHLARDPWPKRALIAPRPHLQAWVARTHEGAPGDGALFDIANLPETLQPVLRALRDEFLPMVLGIRDAVQRHAQAGAARKPRLPRALESIDFPMADGRFRRLAMPYTLWMMQGVQRGYRALDEAQRAALCAAIGSGAAAEALAADVGPALQRTGLRVRWAEARGGARRR